MGINFFESTLILLRFHEFGKIKIFDFFTFLQVLDKLRSFENDSGTPLYNGSSLIVGTAVSGKKQQQNILKSQEKKHLTAQNYEKPKEIDDFE